MKTANISKNSSNGIADIFEYRTEERLSGAGNLALDGDIEIKGVFAGMLKLNGTLTVGKNARITGDLIVNNLTVYGQIVGTAMVAGKASFYEGSRFSGIISASEADFREGSRISGMRRISPPAIISAKTEILPKKENIIIKEAAPVKMNSPVSVV